MMKKNIFYSIASVFFIGCSSWGGSSSNNVVDQVDTTPSYSLNKEPLYSQQWYLEYNQTFYEQNGINQDAHIHAEGFLEGFRGEKVKIAIIDDGLDTIHEELQGLNLQTYDVVSRSQDVEHDYVNGHHGTAVTGILAAQINQKGLAGIASGAEYLFLKHRDFASDSQIIEMFNKAEEFGADIINCSWGTGDVSDIVKDRIVTLANEGRGGKGTIVVFASGNNDEEMGNDESAIPEVIAVGSTDKYNLRAWYSDYGKNLDIMAPGGYYLNITTLDTSGHYGVGTLSLNYLLFNDANGFIGTSASTPIVSGVVAIMLEKNPSLTRVEVENILKNTNDKIGFLSYTNGRNDYYGYGKVNLSSIINHMEEL